MNLTKPLLALLVGTLTAHATPFNHEEIPATSNWHLHADLDNMRNTAVGQLIMDAVQEEHGRQLKAVKRMFSLNPFTDLQGLTLWGTGEKDKAAVLIRGQFDREHLTDLLSAGDSYDTSGHHSHTIHSWKDKKKTQYGAFYGQDLVIISEQKRLIIQTLDVLDDRSESTPHTGESGPAAFLIGLANLDGIDMKGDGANLVQKAKGLHGRFYEEGDRLFANLIIESTSNEEAQRIQKVLSGIIALGELANQDIADLNLQPSVNVQENKVNATLSIPSDRILDAIKEARHLGN